MKKQKQMGSVQLGIKIFDDASSQILTFLKYQKVKIRVISYPQLLASTIDIAKFELN